MQQTIPRSTALLGMVLLLGAGFLGGLLAYHIFFRPTGHLHAVVRRQAILSQAQQVRPGGVVVLGDSIVELALLDSICGQTVLNAGSGGSTLEDVVRLSGPTLALAKPGVVIISVGVNDAQIDRTRNIASWLRRYDALLTVLTRYRVFVMAIDPVEPDKPLGTRYFDQKFIAQQNGGLTALARKHGVVFIAPTPVVTGLTVDGVHPNEMGYRIYKRRLESALGCSSVP